MDVPSLVSRRRLTALLEAGSTTEMSRSPAARAGSGTPPPHGATPMGSAPGTPTRAHGSLPVASTAARSGSVIVYVILSPTALVIHEPRRRSSSSALSLQAGRGSCSRRRPPSRLLRVDLHAVVDHALRIAAALRGIAAARRGRVRCAGVNTDGVPPPHSQQIRSGDPRRRVPVCTSG